MVIALEVDAVIMRDDELILVEVKYLSRINVAERIVRAAIDRISHGVENSPKLRNAWPKIMLILVFKNENDLVRTQQTLKAIAELSSLTVTLRCYVFEELQKRFEGKEE